MSVDDDGEPLEFESPDRCKLERRESFGATPARMLLLETVPSSDYTRAIEPDLIKTTLFEPSDSGFFSIDEEGVVGLEEVLSSARTNMRSDNIDVTVAASGPGAALHVECSKERLLLLRKVNDYKQDIEQLSREKKTLETLCADLANQTHDQQAELRLTRRQHDRLLQLLHQHLPDSVEPGRTSLESTVDHVSKLCIEQHNSLQEVTKERDELRKQVLTLRSGNSAVQQKLEQSLIDWARKEAEMELHIHELDTRSDLLQKSVSQLKERNEELVESLRAERAVSSSMQEAVHEATNKMDELTRCSHLLAQEKSRLLLDFSAKVDKVVELELKLCAAESRYEHVQTLTDKDVKKRALVLEQQVAEMKLVYEKLAGHSGTLRQECLALESELADRDNTIAQLQARITTLSLAANNDM